MKKGGTKQVFKKPAKDVVVELSNVEGSHERIHFYCLPKYVYEINEGLSEAHKKVGINIVIIAIRIVGSYNPTKANRYGS